MYVQVQKATGFTFNTPKLRFEFRRWDEIERKKSMKKLNAAKGDVSEVSGSSSNGNEVNDSSSNGVEVSESSNEEAEEALAQVTLEADRKAYMYLGTLLMPLILGFAIRSLVYEKHASWYSWVLSSLTSCV
jgi:hypothetical protein